MEISKDKLTLLVVANELVKKDLEISQLKEKISKREKKAKGKGMLVTLSGIELEDAISLYLQQQFGKQVKVEVDDEQEVSASITLGSIIETPTVSSVEPNEEKPKQRRTRRTKAEIEQETESEEVTQEELLIKKAMEENKDNDELRKQVMARREQLARDNGEEVDPKVSLMAEVIAETEEEERLEQQAKEEESQEDPLTQAVQEIEERQKILSEPTVISSEETKEIELEEDKEVFNEVPSEPKEPVKQLFNSNQNLKPSGNPFGTPTRKLFQ